MGGACSIVRRRRYALTDSENKAEQQHLPSSGVTVEHIVDIDPEQIRNALKAQIAQGEFRGGREKIEQTELVQIRLLEKGKFGSVDLVRHRVTNETYSLKSLQKSYIEKCAMHESVEREKEILLTQSSNFIIKTYETYQDEGAIYYLLEAALGGDLYSIYKGNGFYGSAPHCKFYAAAAVLALSHLHGAHIIHRDLKPESMLVTEAGCAKLSNMGLAKIVVGKTFTTCGTPAYFAPEVIAGAHGSSVDWWCLGVFIFELMSGCPPFGSNPGWELYRRIKKGISHVAFPDRCHGEVADLIKALLMQDPEQRLPSLVGGVDNIKKHMWYDGFDWQEMASNILQPPCVPGQNQLGQGSAADALTWLLELPKVPGTQDVNHLSMQPSEDHGTRST